MKLKGLFFIFFALSCWIPSFADEATIISARQDKCISFQRFPQLLHHVRQRHGAYTPPRLLKNANGGGR